MRNQRANSLLQFVFVLACCGVIGSAAEDISNCTGPVRIPPPKILATTASAQRVWADSVQTLHRCAPVIRCVDFAILAACGPNDIDTCTYDAFGDGFSRLKLNADGTMPGKAREIMELMENETVSVDLSELEGVNVWLMNNFSVAANITVTVDIFRLPDSLRNSPDRVKQLDYVFNKLEDGGYDCALPSTISSFDRAPLMKFVLPNQPYGADLLRHASENPKHRLRTVFTSTGFLVVSPDPQAVRLTPGQRLFSWTRPFSGPLWITLFATLTAVGVGMAWFEHKKNPRDFSTGHKVPWKYAAHNMWHGIYTSVAHWPGCGFFLSVSVPGRILNVAYSIFCRLLLATYTAGLASNLVVSRFPSRIIKDVSSFQETGIPACVLNRTSHLDFIRQNYPKLQVHVVPSAASITVLLNAVQAGTCGGAISTNVHLQYGIGLGDVDGRFCNLSATGTNLGVGLYALPMHLRTSEAVLDALSEITSAAITDNTYYNKAMSVQFSNNRTVCPPEPPTSKAKFLDLPDTAGIFVIQGVGICAASLIQLWKYLKFKRRALGPAWLWGDPPPPEPLQLKLAAVAKQEEQNEQLRLAEEQEARAALALLLQAQLQQKELLGRIVKAAQARAEAAGEDMYLGEMAGAGGGGVGGAAGAGVGRLPAGDLNRRGPLLEAQAGGAGKGAGAGQSLGAALGAQAEGGGRGAGAGAGAAPLSPAAGSQQAGRGRSSPPGARRRGGAIS